MILDISRKDGIMQNEMYISIDRVIPERAAS